MSTVEDVGVVIPVGPGRIENLSAVLESLNRQVVRPSVVVLVCDGPEAHLKPEPGPGFDLPLVVVHTPKHEPGMEQPRNIGVRELEKFGVSHVWFLDTDVIVGEFCLMALDQAVAASEADVVVGPYDWLPQGVRVPKPEMRNDPRWPSFDRHVANEVIKGDLSAGLACFSGNLLWSIDRFKHVGGFWHEIHHGRCEDGELGLRAVAMGVGITFQRAARGWHLWHEVNLSRAHECNERDVPMLNERHPWVQGEGLFVVEEDGKRFNVRCRCGWEGNTAEIFEHQSQCEAAR